MYRGGSSRRRQHDDADATILDELFTNDAQTLGLFEPDGRAHCVFICPDRVDGKPGKVFDPLMNDQDWALAFYLAIVRLAQF